MNEIPLRRNTVIPDDTLSTYVFVDNVHIYNCDGFEFFVRLLYNGTKLRVPVNRLIVQ